ncbi:60s acidic ribosomal protein-domain-containing protein [Blastocladiella britannica]|nr:60s acidic ribosomal protein-domain-containing protein [Blastocladiella britannica]
MKYIAAFLLAKLGGNDAPSTKDIKAILGAVGIEVEAAELKKVLAELEGKNIDEVIAEGSTKLASVPAGGAASSGSAAPAAGGAAPAAAAEAAPVEEEEEEDEDMGFGLFD